MGIFVLQVKWRKKHMRNLGFGSTRILRRQKAEMLSESMFEWEGIDVLCRREGETILNDVKAKVSMESMS